MLSSRVVTLTLLASLGVVAVDGVGTCGGPRPCVYKCCPLGEGLVNDDCVRSDDPLVASFASRYSSFSLVSRFADCQLEPYVLEQVQLLPNGSALEYGIPIPIEEFCVDVDLNASERVEDVAMVCPLDGNATTVPALVTGELRFKIYPVGMTLSVLGLVATIFTYAVIPELRNCNGLCVVSHISALLVSYVFLSTTYIVSGNQPGSFCTSSAFIIYFSFLASFFWLNVMCLDIFWTFSGFRSLRGTVREREFKKFIIYSIYSWGCPLIMLTICLVMHFHEGIPNDYVKPGFGQSSCWFKDTTSALAYFYGPVAVLILCNIILFILTAVKIAKLKREAEMFNNSESRRHDDEDNKQRFNLYLKLFLVMGVNWATEIISWAAGGPESIWYLTDIANTLQGVLIFIIFVWKDRIRKLLMERFCPKRAASATASKSTAVTYSTRGSSSVSSVKPGGKMNQESLRMTNMATSEESDVP